MRIVTRSSPLERMAMFSIHVGSENWWTIRLERGNLCRGLIDEELTTSKKNEADNQDGKGNVKTTTKDIIGRIHCVY